MEVTRANMEASSDGLERSNSHASSLTSFPSLSPVGSPTTSRHAFGHKSRQASLHHPSTPDSKSPVGPSISKLTRSSPSVRASRPALFGSESTDATTEAPGSLNDASDEHIERLIARAGAVNLVRQLAEDLACRDVQLSSLQRRSEERERLLRRMLLDHHVSSLEIESGLRSIEDLPRSVSGKSDESMETLTEGSATQARKVRGTSSGNDLDQLMSEAMSLTVRGPKQGLTHSRATSSISNHSRLTSNGSGKESSEHGRTRATVRGWKDYLWNGATKPPKRPTSNHTIEQDDTITPRTAKPAPVKRPAIGTDVFQPPRPSMESSRSTASLRANLERSHSQELQRKSSQQQLEASSMTNWAMRLIVGGTSTHSGSSTSTLPSAAQSSLASSTRSTSLSQSKQALPTIATNAQPAGHRRATTAANGIASSSRRTAATMPGLASFSQEYRPLSPVRSHHEEELTNAGPVEMDSILPPESQPPSLNPYAAVKAGLLTDRFGFIYDARHKRRKVDVAESIRSGRSSILPKELVQRTQKDHASEDGSDSGKTGRRSTVSSIRPETPITPASEHDSGELKSDSTKKWHDLLRSPTHRAELLLHSPSSSAMPTLQSLKKVTKKPSMIRVSSDAKLPTVGILSPTNATAVLSNPAAGMEEVPSGSSTPSTRNAAPESVKLLLDQLTELHDSLQREKTVRWNEFLRKVRAERRREDQKLETMDTRLAGDRQSEASLMDGELIGVAGLGNRGRTGRAKWNEFRSLVLGGIPVSYRAKIYSECTGATALKIPGYYDSLVLKGPIDETIEAQIAMDINRTLTDNIFFRQGPGVDKLKEVLAAYSQRNPEVGYCQGMNQIAACLLLIMPSSEETFWVLTSMIENIMPAKYYDHSLLASRADQTVLRQYVSEILPSLASHFEALGIELEALTFQWFLAIFTDCLSAEALFRVWDVVLCLPDGATFLFQVALALLKLNERQLLACETQSGAYSYINHSMTNHAISIDGLVAASEALKGQVRRVDVEERRLRVVEEELERVRRPRRSVDSTKVAQARREAEKREAREREMKKEREDAEGKGEEAEEVGVRELVVQEPVPVEDGEQQRWMDQAPARV